MHTVGRSGGGAGKGRRASLQLHPWNLNICIEKVHAKCWLGGDDISNDPVHYILARVFQCCMSDIRRLRALYPIGAYTTGIEKALRNKL